MIKKFLCLILLLFSVFLVSADSNGIWYYPKDIRGGIFGSDEDVTNYRFQNDVYFEENLYSNNLYSQIGIIKNLTIENRLVSNEIVSNNIEVVNGLKLGFESVCDLSKEGTLRYNSSIKQMEFCNGEIWSPFVDQRGLGIEFVTDLVNEVHNKTECEDAGGEVVAGDVEGVYMCRFDAASCPTDWTQYEDWSTTRPGTARCGYKINYGIGLSTNYCIRTSPSHSWSNAPIEIGGYHSCSKCYPPPARAIVTQIGCY